MTEVFRKPLYFVWRWEQGFPYVVHFYVMKAYRSVKVARICARRLKKYFAQKGFRRIMINARSSDIKIQKAIEYYFKTKPYGEADEHKFYVVEVV